MMNPKFKALNHVGVLGFLGNPTKVKRRDWADEEMAAAKWLLEAQA